jgi:hypothetical protein
VTDDDCSVGGELCTARRNPVDDTQLLRECTPPIGDDATGQQCTAGAGAAQCESGLCGGNPSLCTSFCDGNEDCAANQTCGTVNLTIGGRVFTNLSACIGRSQAQLECDNEADCASRGQTCSEVALIGGLLKPICGNPPGGDGALGDFCDAQTLENPGQCASGFCDDADDGQCIDVCDSDADCAPDLICTDSHLGNVTGRWCAEPCQRMSDCGFDVADADSRICKRRCDPVDPGFELVCTPPVGGRDLNAVLAQTTTACTTDPQCVTAAGPTFTCNNAATRVCTEPASLCKSGFSVSTNGATYCSQPCVDDVECGTGLTCSFVSSTQCGGVAASFEFCRR